MKTFSIIIKSEHLAYAVDGRPCAIPFIYKEVTYHKCTDVDNESGKFWCSMTPDFDTDKEWKRCAGVNCNGNCSI